MTSAPAILTRVLDSLQHPLLLWPARSPSISPIEHVWDQLRCQLRHSANVQDLEERIERLYDSLPHHITACHTLLTWGQQCAHTANSVVCFILYYNPCDTVT
uniref:Tc1-like transposase DDE domain-containing protein n=1 Tax=Paramormyrops kingsleyae TaxID=1676925 RepID=A0A3B3THW8_9TELE